MSARVVPARRARWILLAAGPLLAGATLGACGDDGGKPDARPDTPPMCAGVTAFAGEMVDWDSTDASFCGVNQATWTVRTDTACTGKTAPNGRFQVLIPQQAQTVVDVTPPTAASQCSAVSGQRYQLAGVAIASAAVLSGGGVYTARAMVESRVTSMFTQIGQALNTGRGQLIVHVNGTPRAVSISAAHDATQRFDGTSWAAGDTGRDVLFPNVDVGAPVTVSMSGASVGTGSYTLEPGKLTYLSVIAN